MWDLSRLQHEHSCTININYGGGGGGKARLDEILLANTAKCNREFSLRWSHMNSAELGWILRSPLPPITYFRIYKIPSQDLWNLKVQIFILKRFSFLLFSSKLKATVTRKPEKYSFVVPFFYLGEKKDHCRPASSSLLLFPMSLWPCMPAVVSLQCHWHSSPAFLMACACLRPLLLPWIFQPAL